MRYKAFVSYKHRSGTEFAERLESALKRYAKPLLKPPPRIFRDERFLRPGLDLPRMIRQALEQSEFLLLLASREAAESAWVRDELEIWCRQLRRAPELVIVLTRDVVAVDSEGKTIDWGATTALPASLAPFLKKVPLYVDLSTLENRDDWDLEHPIFRRAVNAIVARFRNVTPDEMIGEELRQHRRNLRLRNAAIAALSLLSLALAWVAVQLVRTNESLSVQLRETLSRQLASQSELLAADQPDLALLLGVEAWRTATNPESRRALLLGLEAHPWLVTHLAGSDGAVEKLRLDPRGKALASVDREGVKLWDLERFQLMAGLPDPHLRRLVALDFSRDGRWLAAAGGDEVTVWQLENRQPMHLRIEMASAVAFAPATDLLAVGTASGHVELVSLGDGMRRRLDPGHQGSVTDLVFDPGGEHLISSALESERPVRVWSVARLRESPAILGGDVKWAVNDLDLSADGLMLAAALENGGVAVWDLASGSPVFSARDPSGATTQSVELLDGARRLVSSHSGGEILLWSLSDEGAPGRFVAHREAAYSTDAWEGTTRLVSGGADERIRIWDLSRSNPLARELRREGLKARQIGWVEGREAMLELSAETLYSWRLESSPAQRSRLDLEPTRALAVSPTGGRALLRRPDGDARWTLEIWDWPDARRTPLVVPENLPSGDDLTIGFRVANFSRTGRYLAVVRWSDTSRVVLWDTSEPSVPPLELEVDIGPVAEVAFDPPEARMVCISHSHGFSLWDLALGERSSEPISGVDVKVAAFSPDGERIYLGEWSGDLEVRMVSSPSQILASSGVHRNSIADLATDPRGRFLVSADNEGELYLWDAPHLRVIGALSAPDGHVAVDLAFDTAGDRLATAGFGIFLWDLDADSWIDLALARANRPLSRDELEQYFPTAD